MIVVEGVGEFVCSMCDAIVPHEPDAEWGATPVPHCAPCGRPCLGGGLTRAQIVLGEVHRGEDCRACHL